jgi:hypothetical protein
MQGKCKNSYDFSSSHKAIRSPYSSFALHLRMSLVATSQGFIAELNGCVLFFCYKNEAAK